jgi:hypothetical protein
MKNIEIFSIYKLGMHACVCIFKFNPHFCDFVIKCIDGFSWKTSHNQKSIWNRDAGAMTGKMCCEDKQRSHKWRNMGSLKKLGKSKKNIPP